MAAANRVHGDYSRFGIRICRSLGNQLRIGEQAAQAPLSQAQCGPLSQWRSLSYRAGLALPVLRNRSPIWQQCIVSGMRRGAYLSLAVWPSRQARNAAAACSRSSALLTLRRIFGGWSPSGVLPLISSTPCRRIRLRLLIRDQLTRPLITHAIKNGIKLKVHCAQRGG